MGDWIAADALGESELLRRGVFKGIVDLQAAINRYLAETNDNPKPFIWTADPHAIIEKVRRGKHALASIHWRRTSRAIEGRISVPRLSCCSMRQRRRAGGPR